MRTAPRGQRGPIRLSCSREFHRRRLRLEYPSKDNLVARRRVARCKQEVRRLVSVGDLVCAGFPGFTHPNLADGTLETLLDDFRPNEEPVWVVIRKGDICCQLPW